MDEIYIWVRQISMMAILSFLTLYLVDGKEKKKILRFLLSLFLLLIVIKPFSAVWNLETLLEAQLELLSGKDEVVGVQAQIDSISREQEETLRKEAEKQLEQWIQSLVAEDNLIYKNGEILFDEGTAGEEWKVKNVEILIENPHGLENSEGDHFPDMVKKAGNHTDRAVRKSEAEEKESEAVKHRLQTRIGRALSLDEEHVVIRWAE